MKPSYLIAVGIDYSDVSRLALHEALELASKRPESEVHVVHVESGLPADALAGAASVPAEAETQLADGAVEYGEALRRLHQSVVTDVTTFEEARTGLGAAPIARVVSHVRTGAPGREIAQLAADLEADVVVVGTHGRTGIARFLLGSVAHAVVTLAPCPVLVVRPKHVAIVPVIEPPCPRCLEARRTSSGRELWCDQHRARHGQRHTYYQDDRSGQETNFPLVFDER